MAELETIYVGDLRTEITFKNSKVITDAPLFDDGLEEYMSPTDMVAAALGSCMLTVMGVLAKRKGVSIEGIKLKISKTMADGPRRISDIYIDVFLPHNNYSEADKRVLEAADKGCAVGHSIHPDIKKHITYHY